MRFFCCSILSFFACGPHSYTQELRATVVVNSSIVEQANNRIFQELQSSVSHFLNTQNFGNQTVLIQEKVHSNFVFIIEDFSNHQFSGSLQVQSFRPVYGTNYISPVFGYLDQDIQFEFRNDMPLNYASDIDTSELMSLLSFYSHLLLAYDLDTFSPMGGQFHLSRARSIQRLARSRGQNGWLPQSNNRNRYQLTQELDTQLGQIFRSRGLYQYHRKVMDQMAEHSDQGLEQLFDLILDFEDLYQINSRSMLLQLFFDVKAQELFQILTRTTTSIPTDVIQSLVRFSPTNSQLWQKINN